MTLHQKEKAQALLTLLEWEFAEDTTVLDDHLIDATNDWISGLTEDEVADICISVFREGI